MVFSALVTTAVVIVGTWVAADAAAVDVALVVVVAVDVGAGRVDVASVPDVCSSDPLDAGLDVVPSLLEDSEL